MLTLVWSYIVGFVKTLLDERYFKAIILLGVAFTFGLLILGTNKIADISRKVDCLPDTIYKVNQATKAEIYNKIDGMYGSAVQIFNAYTISTGQDLQTIVDYTVKSERDARLLKDLIAKSATQTSQETQKQQFKSRYSIDSVKFGPIRVQKVLLLNIDSLKTISFL